MTALPSGGTTRSARPSTAGRGWAALAARLVRGVGAARAPTTRAAAWAAAAARPAGRPAAARRPCSRRPTPMPRSSRLCHADGFVDWPAATTSPATPAPSRSSASSCSCIRPTPPGRTSWAYALHRPTRGRRRRPDPGHNGVVAACYLARAACRSRRWSPTRCSAEGPSPWSVAGVDHRGVHVIIRQSGIIEELDLDAYSLRYVDYDPWGSRPRPSPAIRPGRMPR